VPQTCRKSLTTYIVEAFGEFHVERREQVAVAAEAKWQRLSIQTLEETKSRYGLCQWALESGEPGACTNRTANVYCAKHNRQLEREIERSRKEKAASEVPTPREPAPAQVQVVPALEHDRNAAATGTADPRSPWTTTIRSALGTGTSCSPASRCATGARCGP